MTILLLVKTYSHKFTPMLPILLTIEPKMVFIFKHISQSHCNTCLLLWSILKDKPCHMLLKYRCPIMMCLNPTPEFIRHLNLSGMWLDVDLRKDSKDTCTSRKLCGESTVVVFPFGSFDHLDL